MSGSIAISDLYQAVLVRRSIRRYDETPLDAATLAQVQELVSTARPLVANNQLHVARRDDVIRQDLSKLVGAYGRLMTPPHALAPYIVGDRHALTDLGYRVEQIVVGMTAMGIGTCYVGTLPKERQVRAMLDVPDGARIAALVAFGKPASSIGGRAFNSLIRSALGRNREANLATVYFEGSLDNPSQPPEIWRPLLTAAARAPSACNAQPWRFLGLGNRLVLFVPRHNLRYGIGPSQEYSLFDAGIAMANVSMAMKALGTRGDWQLLQPNEPDVPPHRDTLIPIAILQLA